MGALGFSAGQCGAVLRLLAFLLKLGNVQFEPQHNIDGSIGTRLQHEYGEDTLHFPVALFRRIRDMSALSMSHH